MKQRSLLERVALQAAHLVPMQRVASKLTAPLASISFDDIPHSAARIGAPILERAGVRGTYYVCGAHVGQSFEDRQQHEIKDLVALHEAGHELACHTFAHPDTRTIDHATRLADIKANADFMRTNVGDVALTSFAYPYGAVSLDNKGFYAKQFSSCRGVYGGVNTGTMDFSDLLAVGIESRKHDMGRVRALIDKAVAQNGWLIFYTHDVGVTPSGFGCTPKDLEDVIIALSDAKIETVPVRDAAARVRFGVQAN
jgi:peptidoglycan/xylan/chitin deacetylase (PgdA/CDA1 family)